MKLTCLEPKVEITPPAFPSVNLFNSNYTYTNTNHFDCNFGALPNLKPAFQMNYYSCPKFTPLRESMSPQKRYEPVQQEKNVKTKPTSPNGVSKQQHLMKSKKQGQHKSNCVLNKKR